MLPQPPIPRLSPQGPPRTLAKPPKAPLRGQAPSGAPAPAQDAQIKAVAMQQAQQQPPQRYQGAPPPQRYQAPPAKAPAPMAVQQQMPARAPMQPMQQAPQMDPRTQAIAAMKAATGGDYPNPEWQPKPAYLTTGEAYTPVPVGGVVPATVAPAPVRYVAPTPNAPVVDLGISALNTTPVRGAPDTSGSFIPKNPVEMNPRYVPGMPNEGAVDPTIGPDGQTIEPRPIVPASTTPMRTGPPTGPNPTDAFDWEALADAMGIEGLQEQVKETTAKEALGAMTSDLSEFGFNPEELAAQEAQIIRQAAEAKAKAMQQMAGRGLGGSGLEIAGLGNIDVGAISAMTDLQTENKALQIEQRLNEIKTYLSAYGSQLDDETRKELAAEAAQLQKDMFEYDKTSQAESDRHTLLNNALAQVGADKWDPETLAWAYDQLDGGADVQDILRALGVSSRGDEQTAYQLGGGESGDGGPEGVTVGGQQYGAPKSYGNNLSALQQAALSLSTTGDSHVTGDYATTSDGYQKLYDQYADESAASGLPPLSYPEWIRMTWESTGNTAQF